MMMMSGIKYVIKNQFPYSWEVSGRHFSFHHLATAPEISFWCRETSLCRTQATTCPVTPQPSQVPLCWQRHCCQILQENLISHWEASHCCQAGMNLEILSNKCQNFERKVQIHNGEWKNYALNNKDVSFLNQEAFFAKAAGGNLWFAKQLEISVLSVTHRKPS